MATVIALAVVLQAPDGAFQLTVEFGGQLTTAADPKLGREPGGAELSRKYCPGGGTAPTGVDQCRPTWEPGTTAMELLEN
jgi:hypothetical protein